jgi:2-dehydro-3-deoxy-D-gluconate 5-dehydrogenase
MIGNCFRLDGQVALITGGNRGLGLAMASALAEAGADLVTVQRSVEIPTLAERVAAAGRRVLPLALDLAVSGVAQQALAATLENFGRIDILVNNAGIQRRAPATDFSLADWQAVLAINLDAVFHFCQVVGRQMVQQGHGKIINIASLLAFQGGITVPAYAASKHAIAGLTKALCNEWAGCGVHVNAIAPGYMDTDLNAALRADAARSKAITTRIPAGRWGTPEDVAGAVVFLASSAADYVHGHTLVVDGGWMAR